MKKTSSMMIVLLIGMIVIGWIASLLDNTAEEQKAQYDGAIKLAEDYMNRGLYQLAIAEYDKALLIKDSVKIRDKAFEAYKKRLEESDDILSAYIEAAVSANTMYPEEEKYYVLLAELYIKSGEYQTAYKCLNDAVNSGMKNDDITKLLSDVKYSYELTWYKYDDFFEMSNGEYAVCRENNWGYIDENAATTYEKEYYFVSRVGDEGVRILSKVDLIEKEVEDSESNDDGNLEDTTILEQVYDFDNAETILYDENSVVRGKLSFIPVWAGSYAEELICIDDGKKIGFYNSLGDYKFGEYLNASNFQNGKAAVEVEDGKWIFVNNKGKQEGKKEYQDVKISNNNTYIVNNIMAVKKDDKYILIDNEHNKIGKFECEDIDIISSDGLTAFKKDGKWGFVNSEGKIKIKAEYDEARSFSNGLAAVCKDDKWGFINEDGKVVIEYQFIDADYFNSEGNCFVKTMQDEWQIISLIVEY